MPGPRHLCLQEGTLSEWLYEVLSPHVQELVVAAVEERRGSKGEGRDSFDRADRLRLGAIERKVYRERGRFRAPGYRARGYRSVRGDAVRVKNRIKSLYRSPGVQVTGGSVYSRSGRGEFPGRLPRAARPLAELLYEELDQLTALRCGPARRRRKEMLAEAKRHREYRLVKTCPGLGPVRNAELLPIMVTPYRFASKRGFWKYCGLGIVQRTSSDWVRTRSGEWIRAPLQQTRGLNRNFNRQLEEIFKGAATTVIGRAEDELLYRHYLRLLEGGTKPNLAKLTIARQITSIVLAVWRTGEAYNRKRLEKAS